MGIPNLLTEDTLNKILIQHRYKTGGEADGTEILSFNPNLQNELELTETEIIKKMYGAMIIPTGSVDERPVDLISNKQAYIRVTNDGDLEIGLINQENPVINWMPLLTN